MGQKYLVSFVLYYTQEKHQFEKLIAFNNSIGKLILSDDGNMMFAKRSREVIDLNSFKTIQKFTKEEFSNSKRTAKNSFYNLKFSKNNRYLYYVRRYNIKDKYTHVPIMQEIKTKKVIFGTKYFDTRGDSDIKLAVKFSDNEKYMIRNYNMGSYGGANINSQILYPIVSENSIKTFFDEGGGANLFYTAWHDDMLAYRYYMMKTSKDSGIAESGIYDVKNNITYCRDVDFPIAYEIIWNDDNIYIIGEDEVFPYVFKDNKCIKMLPYSHYVSKIDDSKEIKKFISNNEKVTLYSQNKVRTKISIINLKKYTQKDIDKVNDINKAQKLLDSGFEKRGLKLIDKLIQESDDIDWINNFSPKKYKYAYKTYAKIKYLNKEIQKSNTIDWYMGYIYGDIIKIYSWYGYEYLIPTINKRLAKVSKFYNSSAKEFYENYNSIAKSIYLSSINKNKEAYDVLFDSQPLEFLAKSFVVELTYCKSPIAKDLDKLAIATNIKKSRFDKPSDCHNNFDGGHPFLFDIDGNKVFKNAQKNKLVPKKTKVKKIKKSDAIELLD